MHYVLLLVEIHALIYVLLLINSTCALIQY